MNILFFSRLFFPHIGGVEKHVLEISNILIKDEHKIAIVTEKHQKDIMPKESIEGIDVYRISNLKQGWFKKFQIWKWIWENRILIKSADIIHCHDIFFWYLPFRFLFFKKPVYTTFHGYENYPLKIRQIIMHRISEKLSHGNICVGDFMKKWYGTRPNFVTYGGVNITKIQNSKFRIQNYNPKLKIVFIGRLEKQTGIITYLKALKVLNDKGHKVKLDIYGDGIQALEAKKFCSKYNLDIVFHGFAASIDDVLKRSNYAFVSRYLSILEAMAAKRLVFAVYDNPLKEDYLKLAPFARFIIITKSPVEIAEKVEYYSKHYVEKQILIDKGYEWVVGQSWKKLKSMYLDLWNADKIT